MNIRRNRPGLGVLVFFGVAFSLSLYFTFAAVQGDFGLFSRAEILKQADDLRAEKAVILAQVAQMENLTHRLSDEYLDLDLLDQQARDVLGVMRHDEILID